jgi:UDP-glucose 4-epimerase
MSTMVVLVTGASGYLGRAVVSSLAAAGHQVRALAGDILEALGPAVAGVDAVVHLAALTRVRSSFEEPIRYFQVNVTGTLNLLEAVAPGTRFVFASSASAYGTPISQPIKEDCPLNPLNPYAASKAAAESALGWAATTGRVSATTLRVFNLAGAVDGHGDPDPTRILPRAVAAAAGTLSHVDINGPGSAIRDFVHISDAAAAFVMALESDSAGHRVYNVGAIPASVNDILAATRDLTGKPVPVVHHPAHPGEAPDLRADTTRIRTELGWSPTHTTLTPLIRDQWHAAVQTP